MDFAESSQSFFEHLLKYVSTRPIEFHQPQNPGALAIHIPVIVVPFAVQNPVFHRQTCRYHLHQTVYHFFRPCNSPNYQFDDQLQIPLPLNRPQPTITPRFQHENILHAQLVSLVARDMKSDYENFVGRNFSGYSKKTIRAVAMHILGANAVNQQIVNAIVSGCMRFISPPFQAPLNLPPLPAHAALALTAVVQQIRAELQQYNWGNVVPGESIEKLIIRRSRQLGPDLIRYFRFLRGLLIMHNSDIFYSYRPRRQIPRQPIPNIFRLIIGCFANTSFRRAFRRTLGLSPMQHIKGYFTP